MCVAAVAALSGVSVSSAPAQRLDRGAWQQDYALLKQALEKRYSNLAWFASPEGGVNLPALDRRTRSALQTAESDDDARDAILGFVRAFHDGHFSQLVSLDTATTVKSAQPPVVPYARGDAATGCAGLGYAPGGLPQFSVPFEGLPGFHLIADGIGTPFRAGVLTADDPAVRVGIVRIPVFEELASQALCLKALARDDLWNPAGRVMRAPLRRTVERDWYETLAGILRTFTAEGVAAVIVDVGNNSGGDDSGDIAARLFTTKPLHSSPLWMSQDSAASNAYFIEQSDALHDAQRLDSNGTAGRAAAAALATFARGQRELAKNSCPMDWVWQTRRSWSANTCRRLVEAGSAGGPLGYLSPDSAHNTEAARQLHWPTTIVPLWGSWTGPLYVLTDSRTYSSAEMFAAVLQNNAAAKTIGTRTGGDGCGFMTDPAPLVLPHSRLRFRVPNCVRMRADGTDEVAGVKPDIPVLPTEGESARARAKRLVDEVVADTKAKRPR